MTNDRSESIQDTSARLLATGVFAAGVGTALYKGFSEHRTQLNRAANRFASPRELLPPMFGPAVEMQREKDLKEAFSALDDTMDPAGKTAFLQRAYQRAIYKTAVEIDDLGESLGMQLASESLDWDTTKGVIAKYEHQMGGMQGLYDSLREISGGTVRGNRGKDLAQVIKELPSSDWDPVTGSAIAYNRSDFQSGGAFWKNRFDLQTGKLRWSPNTSIDPAFIGKAVSTFGQSMEHKARFGIRESNRPRIFQEGTGSAFTFKLPGTTKSISLPFSELALGDNASPLFMTMPRAQHHGGLQLLASDHRGKSFSAVPHFTIPKANGVGVEIVSFNEGIDLALYGDKSGKTKGLALTLAELKGNEAAQRRVIRAFNQEVRSLQTRINTQADMTKGLMTTMSVRPIERLLAASRGEVLESTLEGLTSYYEQVSEASRIQGFGIGAMSSADTMGKQYGVSLVDWAARWDTFGEGFPMERKYGGRFKPFDLTDQAREAMKGSLIGGTLERGFGITSTLSARAELAEVPQAVAYLSLDKAVHLSEEEAFISSKLGKMMERQKQQSYEILKGSSQAKVGMVLGEGSVIGIDYKTGKTIFAKNSGSRLEQRIIGARSNEDITKVVVSSTFGPQDQTKIFDYKAQLQIEHGSMQRRLIHEVKAGSAALRFSSDVEMIGHADLMKSIPQELNKQMAEASFLIMQKRLKEAGVLRAGGKSKVERQKMRAVRGRKTYTWKGGRPKDYINQNMLNFVRDQRYRDKVLANRRKSGLRLAKTFGLKGDQEAMGVGLELIRYAKKQGLAPDELGLIGGAFYKTMSKATGSSQTVDDLLTKVGLSQADISGLASSKGVLAMPSLHVGDYASLAWGRAGMDYRALAEVKAQQWGEAGDLLINEIARRTLPSQNYSEMEKAALSLSDRAGELDEGIDRIDNLRDAYKNLGQKSFMFDYGGSKVYVPGPDARGMGDFISEIEDIQPQELKGLYNRYFRAHENLRDHPGDASELRLNSATQELRSQVHKEFASSLSLRGKVIGSAGPVARRVIPTDPSAIMSKTFSSADDVLKDTQYLFKGGMTKDTAKRMFRDLSSNASDAEKLFLAAQEKAFFSGGDITAAVWRHPTHKPQSFLPMHLKLMEGEGEGMFFYNTKLEKSGKILDISAAQGMGLDFDFDRTQVAIIANEKVKVATDQMMASQAYRQSFLEGVEIQHDLGARAKAAALTAGKSADEADAYVKGLQRLVGVKLETGPISNLVGEMRVAAQNQASTREATLASYLFSELEQQPISGKHGLEVGNVKEHLETFVRRRGSKVDDALGEVWNTIFGMDTFDAGGITYDKKTYINQIASWVSGAQENGSLQAHRDVVRFGAQAQKGKKMGEVSPQQLSETIDKARSGIGNINDDLARTMRMGPGSELPKSRAAISMAQEVGNVAMQAFKKHWKYPAIGAAMALGISAVFGGSQVSMKDHNQQVTDLGQGAGVPQIAGPTMNPNRIVSSAGGSAPVGYGMNSNQDYNGYGVRQIGDFGAQTGASVRIRDDRGAITPEYINKAQRERYV